MGEECSGQRKQQSVSVGTGMICLRISRSLVQLSPGIFSMSTGKLLGGFKLHYLIYILKDHFSYLLCGE